MGYDKPDLAFCVHLGSPASPVAYYQQVGRAGRALRRRRSRCWCRPRPTSGSGSTSPPPASPTRRRSSGSSTCWPTSRRALPALEAATGIRRGRLEMVLKILAVDDAVRRAGPAAGWRPARPGTSTRPKWNALRAGAGGRGGPDARLRARRGLPDAVPAAGAGRPRSAPVRPLLGLHRRAAGAGSATDRRRRVEAARRVLPRPGRGHRAAQAVGGRGLPGPQGQDHASWRPGGRWRSPTTRPGTRCWPRCGRPTRPAPPVILDGLVEVLVRWSKVWERPVAVVAMPSGATRCWSPRWPSTSPRSAGCRWSTRSRSAARRRVWTAASAVRATDLLSAPASRPASASTGPVLLVDDTIRTRWTATVAGALLADAGPPRCCRWWFTSCPDRTTRSGGGEPEGQ